MDKDLGARPAAGKNSSSYTIGEASDTTRKYVGNSATVNIFHPKLFGDNRNLGIKHRCIDKLTHNLWVLHAWVYGGYTVQN